MMFPQQIQLGIWSVSWKARLTASSCMMKQTSPSLAICFKLLMTVIRILSDISVMLIYWMWSTGPCHYPDDEGSGMASSFTGWGGCPLVQTSWRLDGSSLLHCMDNPQESPWLKLGTICILTNRRNHCISWPIMSNNVITVSALTAMIAEIHA